MTFKEIPERLSRLKLLLKEEGLEKLNEATVMVLGLGGVGSNCTEALARGGIGSLILIDGDVVDTSNINRQAIAFHSTVGRVKAEVMAEMVRDINPDCQIYAQQLFLKKDQIAEMLGTFPRPDYVIDCIDTVSQKLAVAEWCAQEGLPLLSSMGAANKLDPTYLKFSYVEHTNYCPLSKVMRIECRKRGIQHLEVLFSNEVPFKVNQPEGNTKAQTLGSMSYMPPIMGQMLAGKVIRRLAGLEIFKVTPKIHRK